MKAVRLGPAMESRLSSYTMELEELALTGSSRPGDISRNLDGRAFEQVRSSLGTERLRRHGVFFTSAALAEAALEPALSTVGPKSIVYDPACGAGDLLICVARLLPVKKALASTLGLWGQVLAGTDLFPDFIAIARLRLALLAISRGSKAEADDLRSLSRLLPMLRVGDALTLRAPFRRASHVVMNPPYTRGIARYEYTWRTGSVSQAAEFVFHAARNSTPGTVISGVLPEVLRTGSSYRAWREATTSMASVSHVQSHGLFGTACDIDVFSAHFICDPGRASVSDWTAPSAMPARTVGDAFDVSTGSVVPHRDQEDGPVQAYLDARNTPPWATVHRAPARRAFSCTSFYPPFIALRRTSRPGDKHRAVGTIVSGKRPVLVENHLLVVSPHSGTLKACKELLASLKRPETTNWLNVHCRCRHLTVGAVARLPLATSP